MTARRDTRSAIAAIALYGWANGSLAAGVGRLHDRFDASASTDALHLVAFACGLTATGILASGRRAGQRVAPVVFAIGLVPFVVAPSPVVSIPVAFVLGVAGSITLARAQSVIGELARTDAQRTLVIANIAAAATATSAAAAVGWTPGVALPITMIPAVVCGVWVATGARGIRPTSTVEPSDSIRMLPSRVETIGLALTGLVVAIEFTLGNQIVGYLETTGTSQQAAIAPALLFVGLTIGRIAMSLAPTLDPQRVITVALMVVVVCLATVQLTEADPVRLAAITVVGFAIGPLYPLAIATVLATARSTVVTSAHSTAAIGIALLVAPLLVGVTSDLESSRTGFAVIIAIGIIGFATSLVRTATTGTSTDSSPFLSGNIPSNVERRTSSGSTAGPPDRSRHGVSRRRHRDR